MKNLHYTVKPSGSLIPFVFPKNSRPLQEGLPPRLGYVFLTKKELNACVNASNKYNNYIELHGEPIGEFETAEYEELQKMYYSTQQKGAYIFVHDNLLFQKLNPAYPRYINNIYSRPLSLAEG